MTNKIKPPSTIALKDIITPNLTLYDQDNNQKKRKILEKISQLAAKQNPDLNPMEILEALIKRERIGSTAVGHGVALPHARISGIEHPLCIVLALKNAINFSDDSKSPNEIDLVDIIFSLLVPTDATELHLKLLAALNEKLQSKAYRDRLRQANTDQALYESAISNE